MSGRDVIDPLVWVRLRELARQRTPDLPARLIEIFLEDSSARLLFLRQALEQDDRTRLAALAHGLAGSAGALGLGELRAYCLDLEELLSCGGPVDAAGLVDAIHQAFERARVALAEMRDCVPPPS